MEVEKHRNKVEVTTLKKANLMQKMVEKRDKKSTLHLFHYTIKRVELM